MTNIFKVLLNKFKNKTPKKTNETIKKTQIGFIGKTKTVEIIDNQDVVDLVTASYGQITNETDDKLNKLKAYSDGEDAKNKRELNQTISDNKQELDAIDADLDKRIKQNQIQINQVNQTANTANNNANTANQNANNALNVANRADNKADNATNTANGVQTKLNRHLSFPRWDGVPFIFRKELVVQNNFFTGFKLMATTDVHILTSRRALDITIDPDELDKAYEYLTYHREGTTLTFPCRIFIAGFNARKGNKFTQALGGLPYDLRIDLQPKNNPFTFQIPKTMFVYDVNWGVGNENTQLTIMVGIVRW